VNWTRVTLSYYANPVYLGIEVDRILS